MRGWNVAVYEPLSSGSRTRVADMGISPRVTTLRYTTGPNGLAGAEVGLAGLVSGLQVGYLPKPIDIGAGDTLRDLHVEIRYGTVLVFDGRIAEVERGDGGLVIGCILESYLAALNDDYSRDTTNSSVTSGVALQTAIVDYAPLLTPASGSLWVDPNIVHSGGQNEFIRMTPGQIGDQVTKDGNSVGYPVDMHIRPGRSVSLTERRAPSTPHYRIPFDRSIVSQWRESLRNMASHVTVEYGTGATGTLTAEASVSSPRVLRKKFITAGNISSAAATAMRDRELTQRSTPEVQATVSIGPAQPGLRRFDGQYQPYYLVWPWEWLQVGDYPMQPIVGTTIDATAGTGTYELGVPDQRLLKNANLTVRDTVSRVRASIHPQGGRTRG